MSGMVSGASAEMGRGVPRRLLLSFSIVSYMTCLQVRDCSLAAPVGPAGCGAHHVNALLEVRNCTSVQLGRTGQSARSRCGHRRHVIGAPRLQSLSDSRRFERLMKLKIACW